MSFEAFHCCTGVAAPMLRPNIDTDAIIPSREMKRVSKVGLGEGLFAGERYVNAQSRETAPEFVLNQPGFEGCCILLAGPNFGCGSSREHAVWALREFGIRAIVAPSFGSIFANNCVRNGLLPVTLAQTTVEDIADWVLVSPSTHQVTINLESQRLLAGPIDAGFEVDAGARHMLLNGLDAIALTLTRWDEIAEFDRKRRESRPWLYQNKVAR